MNEIKATEKSEEEWWCLRPEDFQGVQSKNKYINGKYKRGNKNGEQSKREIVGPKNMGPFLNPNLKISRGGPERNVQAYV